MSGTPPGLTDLSAEQYRALIERTSDVVSVVDEEGTILYQSPSSEHVKGWRAEELRGDNILEYVHPDDVDRVAEQFGALTHETGYIEEPVEFRFRSKDDEWIWLATTGSAPEAGSPIDGYITTSRDVTERIEYERSLERYRDLVENVPVGIYRSTPDDGGRFVEVNPAMAEIFDAASIDELLARPVVDLYVDPDDRARFVDRLAEEEAVTEAELELQTRSGDRIWAEITAIVSEVDGETYFDGVVQDLTARKRYEERLQEQRDDLELLNEVVRHDIRNDLQLVTAYLDMLEAHVEEDGQEYLETVRENAEQAVELTTTARDLAEVMLQSEEELLPVSLSSTIEGQLEEIRSAYPRAVVTAEGRLPAVTVEADSMLDAVFRNLLQNAIQHNDADVPEVTIGAETVDDRVRVRIADNGPGVSDSQKKVIFGKGETDLDSAGTGVGLYLVETLVDRYGGDVWVEDNEPRGAVFVVELPIVD